MLPVISKGSKICHVGGNSALLQEQHAHTPTVTASLGRVQAG